MDNNWKTFRGNVLYYAFVYLVFRQIHKAAIVWRKNTFIANFLQI